MTTRILPAEEWHRLPADLGALAPYLNPAETRMVVVEQDDAIVACWAIARIVHLEGLWIDPLYRKSPSIGRRLLRGAYEQARAFGAEWVFTGADTDEIRVLLDKIGATRVPMDLYALAVKEKELCQPSPSL